MSISYFYKADTVKIDSQVRSR